MSDINWVQALPFQDDSVIRQQSQDPTSTAHQYRAGGCGDGDSARPPHPWMAGGFSGGQTGNGEPAEPPSPLQTPDKSPWPHSL